MAADTTLKDALLRQLDMAWALTRYHLETLTTEECLWRPAPIGLHVHAQPDGRWLADWPESQGYHIGPPSIAWTTWHICFWWTMALANAQGPTTITREAIAWPGNADALRQTIALLYGEWRQFLLELPDAEFLATTHSRWPMPGRPFADIVAWLNVELMKNAAEIGYARFLYAAQPMS